MHRLLAIGSLLGVALSATAHDTWVQPNTAVVRTGDAVHLDLMLGNHGNDHRDFKLASKVSPETVRSFDVIAPSGKRYDLKPDLVDLGYAPKEGYLSARFVTAEPGLYTVAQTGDQIVNHGVPTRSVKSAKTYFVASPTLDKLPAKLPGFDAPLGHPFELVPVANPVSPAGPGMPMSVRLVFDGKPLPATKVSFIPRGVTLKDGADADYERTTDENGRATFEPKFGTYYLIVAHLQKPEQAGEGFVATKYSATLTVLVPQQCPCCGE